MLTQPGGCDMLPFVSGGLAQLGERLICIQEVSGSIPLFSTTGNESEMHLEN